MAEAQHIRDDKDSSGRRLGCAITLVVVALLIAAIGYFFDVPGLIMGTHSSGESTQSAGTVATTGVADAGEAGEQTAAEGEAAAGDASEAATTQVEPVQISIRMIGDVLMHMRVYNSGLQDDGTYNYDHLFANIAGELEGADVKIVDQETVLGGVDMGLSGYPSFNSPQEVGDSEAAVGFNLILRASNHSMDMGYVGLHSELQFWRDNHPEVTVIGATDVQSDDPLPANPYIYEKDGMRVAFLNYTYDLNGYEDPSGAVAILDEETIRADVQAAKEQADMVVVCPHWGSENSLVPDDSQYGWAQVFLEEGVDVVLGNHPHVIEPVEVMEGEDGHQMVVFWSTGNFVSTMISAQNMVGGMAEVTLERLSDGTCRVANYAFVPIVTRWGNGTGMTSYFLRDYTYEDYAATVGRSDVTPEWANEFCASVLGEAYDTSACALWVDLTSAQDTGSTSATEDEAATELLPAA